MTIDSVNHRRLRWQTLLKQAVINPSPALPASEIQSDLEAKRRSPRLWLYSALRAIAAARAGTKLDIAEPLPDLVWPQPAANGIAGVSAVWQAYLQASLGDPVAQNWLAHVIKNLSPTAFNAGPNDNPEPWWASELMVLHALQSFALLTGDASLEAPLRRCVEFHLAEIQPDHATNEPWAIHAFGLHPDGNITGETLLHAGFVQGGGALTSGATLIAADALFALENAKLPG
jgi:hypothetical protein